MQATTLNPNPPPTNAPLVPLGGAGSQLAPPALLKQKPRRRVLTSLTLQIFIFFGGWWSLIYYIINILVFIYKGLALPYPNTNFAAEFSISFIWALVEVPRLFLASKGNKTERGAPLIFSFVLALPVVAMMVYFIAFQTYVLKVDQLLNGIGLAFIGAQLLFGIWAAATFVISSRFT